MDAAAEAPPAISTVLLCWNRLPLSQRVLDAYLTTVSVPHELFVINNASTDGTAAWAEGLRGRAGVTDVVQRDRNDPAQALNKTLPRCRASILHVLENDHLCLSGWDAYVLDCFDRLPELGQLGMIGGAPAFRGARYKDVVVAARSNVLTSSWFRREIIERGVLFRNAARGTLPDDSRFSADVRRAGYLVAWSDRRVAVNLGHTAAELERDPDYYVRDYGNKLLDRKTWADAVRGAARLDVRYPASLVRRFLSASLIRLRKRQR